MLEKTITVTLPEAAYHRLQRAAELTHRSLDDILISALNVTLSVPSNVPSQVADELAAMAMLSDQALWAATEPSLSPAQQRRLRQLTRAGGERVLTQAESVELNQLLELYDRSVIRRARALALLSFRGFALPNRVDLPEPLTDDDAEDTQAAD